MKWFNVKRIWQIAALVLTLAGALAVVFAPLFTTITQEGAGQIEVRASAFDVDGPAVLWLAAIPVVLAAIPLTLKHRAWVITSYVCALGLILFSVISRATIGMFFFPASLIALVAAFIHYPKQVEH